MASTSASMSIRQRLADVCQARIPNATAFAGLAFWSQSAGLSNANNLGVVFSAGLLSIVGG